METLKSYNPATGALVGEVPVTQPEDISAVVHRSRVAQPAWAALGHEGRARLLTEAAESFRDKTDDLARLITQEMGKPLFEAEVEAKSLAHVASELAEIGVTDNIVIPWVFDGLGFDAPIEKKKDSLKRFADTYIHSGWQNK